MNTFFKAGLVVALGFAASAAYAANEVVVTPVANGNTLSLAFDMATDGNVGGFNFKVAIPGLGEQAAKMGSCVAELPAGFQGECSVTKGGVYVYAVSNNPEVSLPKGVVSVGTVELTYPGARAKLGEVAPKVEELAVFDNQANPLPATSQVVPIGGRANDNNARFKQR